MYNSHYLTCKARQNPYCFDVAGWKTGDYQRYNSKYVSDL